MFPFLLIIDTPEDKSEFLELYNNYHKDAYRAALTVVREHHLALDAVQIPIYEHSKKILLDSQSKKVQQKKICL